MISDYEIKECYKEDTIGRKYHTPITTKNNTTICKGESSEPMTLKLDEPMDWSEFKELSDSLQTMYITHLREKYNVSQGKLATMFGIVQSTIYNCCVKLGIADLFNKSQMDKEQKAAWKEFLSKRTVEEPKVVETIEPNIENTLAIGYFEIGFSGKFNADNIANTLSKLIADGTDCKIHITVENDCER